MSEQDGAFTGGTSLSRSPGTLTLIGGLLQLVLGSLDSLRARRPQPSQGTDGFQGQL